MSRTPVLTTAVPADLALSDDASTLGKGEGGGVQLQVAAAQAAVVLEHAFPAETGGDATVAAGPFAGALADREDLALSATAQADADSAEDRDDGAQPATAMPFSTTTEAPSPEAEAASPEAEPSSPEAEPSSPEAEPSSPEAEAASPEAPPAEAPSAGDTEEEGFNRLSMPAPGTDDSPPNLVFTAPADDTSTSAGATSAAPPGPPETAQLRIAPSAGGPRTLTQAIDTAAKLAADANAAAEALDSLKRLLRQGLPSSPTHQPRRAVPGIRHPLQLAPAPSSMPPKPPPVPAAAPARRLPVAPLPAPPPPPAEPMRIDVRGFLAGFALSWAIGVVLYLFMTAG